MASHSLDSQAGSPAAVSTWSASLPSPSPSPACVVVGSGGFTHHDENSGNTAEVGDTVPDSSGHGCAACQTALAFATEHAGVGPRLPSPPVTTGAHGGSRGESSPGPACPAAPTPATEGRGGVLACDWALRFAGASVSPCAAWSMLFPACDRPEPSPDHSPISSGFPRTLAPTLAASVIEWA